MTSLLDKISEHGEELIVLLTAERGATLAQARWEIDLIVKALGPAVLQMELREEEQDVQHIGHITKRYTPIGVVGAISPWNLPVFLSFTKILPALLAGNTVVLKPSPFTPLTVLRIADYVHELLPPGVLNVVTGGDDLGPWITSHPGINLITFTGSTFTGKRVLDVGCNEGYVSCQIGKSACLQELREDPLLTSRNSSAGIRGWQSYRRRRRR